MEKPTGDTTPAACLQRSAFTCAAVAADLTIAGPEQALVNIHALLKGSVRLHEDLLEDVQRREAILAVTDSACDRVVNSFELRLLDFVNKHREDPTYRRYFKGKLRDVTQADRRTEEPVLVAAMIRTMREDATKPGIGPIVTEFCPLLEQALAAVKQAIDALSTVETDTAFVANRTIPTQMAIWAEEYVKLHAALEGALPRDPDRVEGFFRPFRKPRKEPAAAEPTKSAPSPVMPSGHAGDAPPVRCAEPPTGEATTPNSGKTS